MADPVAEIALAGANVIVCFGHGNGFPNRMAGDLHPDGEVEELQRPWLGHDRVPLY